MQIHFWIHFPPTSKRQEWPPGVEAALQMMMMMLLQERSICVNDVFRAARTRMEWKRGWMDEMGEPQGPKSGTDHG